MAEPGQDSAPGLCPTCDKPMPLGFCPHCAAEGPPALPTFEPVIRDPQPPAPANDGAADIFAEDGPPAPGTEIIPLEDLTPPEAPEPVVAEEALAEPEPPQPVEEPQQAIVPIPPVKRADPPPAPSPAPPRQPEPIDPNAPAPGSDEEFILRMKELKDLGMPAVAFIGFRTAGKTWLVHRFIEQISDVVDCDPPFMMVSPEETEGAKLEASTKFDFYRIETDEPYCLIDTPGEETEALMRGEVHRLWRLIAVLRYASAIIIAMPADVLIFGSQLDKPRQLDGAALDQLLQDAFDGGPTPEQREEAAFFIEGLRKDSFAINQFAQGVARAAAAISYVRTHNIDCLDKDRFAASVTLANVRNHRSKRTEFQPVGGRSGLDCPAYFALTKADRIVSALFSDVDLPDDHGVLNERKAEMQTMTQTRVMAALARRAGLGDRRKYPLTRPADLVRQVNRQLHHRLVTFFPMGRFDFVTAFFGHDYTDRVHYNHYDHHPGHGVEEMRNWIREARRLAQQGARRLGHYSLARRLHHFIHRIESPEKAKI